MCKKTAIINEIAINYHSAFKVHPEAAMDLAKYFDVGNVVETAIAEVGNIDFIDAGHSDFSDGTEAKTASVTAKKGSKTYFDGAITNVTTPSGTPKSGDIRLVVYNEYTNSTDCFYLPDWVWKPCITQGGEKTVYKNGRVTISYNSARDEYQFCYKYAPYDLNQFRIDDFELMSKLSPTEIRAYWPVSYGLYE